MLIEDFYRAIIESADDPVFISDGDGRYLYANAKASSNLGLTPEQFNGKSVDDIFPPDVAAGFRQGVRHVIESGETLRSEDRLIIGGVESWNSTLLQPLRDVTGHIVAVQGIVRDITSRKQAEMALQQSEERLRQVLLASNIGIWDYDSRYPQMYFSPQQREIWGLTPDEPVTWGAHHDLIHPDDRAKLDAAVAQLRRESADGVFAFEHRIIRKDGTTRWLSIRGQSGP